MGILREDKEPFSRDFVPILVVWFIQVFVVIVVLVVTTPFTQFRMVSGGVVMAGPDP